MASNFNTDPVSIDLSRLQAQLLVSGLQQKDNPLYQVINQLIAALKQVASGLNTTTSGGSADISGLKNRTYWTELNETPNLPQSREVIAGTGITLDYSVPNEVTLNATAGPGSDGYWIPLTDGDPDETDLIFANGECIAVFVPTP